MSIIDCHAHVNSLNEARYQRKDQPLRVPGGNVSIEDLRKISAANGVTAVRAVPSGQVLDCVVAISGIHQSLDIVRKRL